MSALPVWTNWACLPSRNAARARSHKRKFRNTRDISMAMSVGPAGGGQTADINVTPLIDVLLVLLIIFMVITPLTPKGLEALVPQPPPPNTPPSPQDRTVVVQVLQGENGGKIKYKINQEDVD